MRFPNLILLLGVVLSACSNEPSSQPSPSANDIQTAIAKTMEAESTQSYSPATPTSNENSSPPTDSSPTPPPSGPITGRVNVAFLNLRTGPSTLFPVLKSFPASTELQILKRVETNDWVQVEIGEEDEEPVIGWMLTSLLIADGDITNLGLEVIPDERIISGRVEDTNNNPINDVGIALIYREEDEEFRADTNSNDSGDFIFYLPEDVFAILDVQIVGIGCDSKLVDINCNLSGYFNIDRRSFINPPQAEPIIFIYETATTTLTGTVFNQNNDPVANVLVIAERDDGAESYGSSTIGGYFEIPIGEGIWDVYTVILDPRREGEATQISVTKDPLEPIDLITP